MNRFVKSAVAVLICFALMALPVSAAQNENIEKQVSEASAGLSALGGKAGTMLVQEDEFPAGTSTCDWCAMALALSGSSEDYESYLAALQAYVEDAYAADGGLDKVKSTPYHRIALTVLALGGDPTSFGTKPDGTPIDLIADGTYAFAGSSIGSQGLNGWIYALLALDASGAEVPNDAKFSRESMVREILSAQEADGGFGLVSGKSNVDVTAMALQALAPYRQECPQQIEAVLNYLSGAMSDECLYSAYGAESVESSAQVILALCALGIDPAEDGRFCRGDETLLTGIAHFQQKDGTFGHLQDDTEGNYLATAQTLLALTAVQKLRCDGKWIFDFSDYTGPNQRTQSNNYLIYAVAGIAVAALIICIAAGKRRKHGKSNG